MMVTFVAQCEKKSLNKTRRVLDSFANRIGSRTWQTVITLEGLKAVKKLLRKTASKNTAVSCHWIRSRSRSELVWIVGNRSKFNDEGFVPVNYTEQDIDHYSDNYQWKMIPFIEYATAIAAMFHDFGKATILFQQKIDPNVKTAGFEPFRHEWISLRLFQAFVGDKSDYEWLTALSQIEHNSDTNCFKDGVDGGVVENHPIQKLSSPFARFVAWLILVHHKLPIFPKWKVKTGGQLQPEFKNSAGEWFTSDWLESNFNALWNSHSCKDLDQQNRVKENWQFAKGGLPYLSQRWRSEACILASKAMVKLNLKPYAKTDWLTDQLFAAHISRLSLMLADHYYSAQEKITAEWRSQNYVVWANTNRGKFKQRLDEHLIGVTNHVREITRALPRLNETVSVLNEKDTLKAKVKAEYKKDFGWQDDARKCSEKLAKATITQGFFGINMASTGKGKTLANAKIMYAIGEGTGRKRFSVALGLRTLTLQTGREYRKEIRLNDEELAIAVGGGAVKQLFENEQSKQHESRAPDDSREMLGAESCEALLDPDLTINYQGDFIKQHSLSKWTGQEKNLDSLINAPVLVCTIDHLMPATEGTKGGKQIAPMLRLLTADLVLDEPDDFGLKDLPALCRLVHWAGLLGSRVLLSTATMPPSLAYALFLAYKAGWQEYARANIADRQTGIVCAWFDEFRSTSGVYADLNTQYKIAHENFVKKRVKKLNTKIEPKQKGRIAILEKAGTQSIAHCMAESIQKNLLHLHKDHQQSQNNKTISLGLVRMANIDPLVAVTRELLTMDVPDDDTAIHYCVYHSKYPLAIRSHLENKLDRILKRKDPKEVWQQPEIKEKVNNGSCSNHIFVTIASPVAEVGRDHDYDWAIVEPSSMRSIIQLAGRVLRHRPIIPANPNIILLNKNYKTLAGKEICFNKPGFETVELERLGSHDLLEILTSGQFATINAVPRIIGLAEKKQGKKTWGNLVELEHKALEIQLFFGEKPANVWWNHAPQWCGEVQRQQRFRESQSDEAYYLCISDEGCKEGWQWKNEDVSPPCFTSELPGVSIKDITLENFGKGNDFWFKLNAAEIYKELAEDLKITTLAEVSRRFGELRIVEYNNIHQEYKYHPNLGLFRERGAEK